MKYVKGAYIYNQIEIDLVKAKEYPKQTVAI